MMVSTLSTHLMFMPPYLQHSPLFASLFDLPLVQNPSTRRRPRPIHSFSHSVLHLRLNPVSRKARSVFSRVRGDGAGAFDAASDTGERKSSRTSSLGGSYVPLFVEMLGLEKDPQDREQAVVALWRYSMGGKKCVDEIMQFQGCINLIVNLLKSESFFACEAAAGLIQTIASVNIYRDLVEESGAIEEMLGLLSSSSLPFEGKLQSLYTLGNLSADERFRVKIINADILPLLVELLDDESIPVRKAVGGVLKNLALSRSTHSTMVEAGLIPKMAKLLGAGEERLSAVDRGGGRPMLDEDLLVMKKEARNVLLELAKDEYYKILIIEQGLVPIPLIGADTYKSFRPDMHTRPGIPDSLDFEQADEDHSPFGASKLFMGLSATAEDVSVDKAKENALDGWARQHYLGRMEFLETEYDEESKSGHEHFTLLPWIDGVARLVMILRLDGDLAVSKAAKTIADVSISEHMRTSFSEAGAVKPLVRLLDSESEAVKLASICALDKLCVSDTVREEIEGKGVLRPLINTVKNVEGSGTMLQMALNLLTRILNPSKAMKLKLCDGSTKAMDGKTPIQEISFRNDVLDPAFIACLVEVLKSSPDLQTKAASILEFATVIESGMDTVISVDIQSGLHALFQQNILNDVESDMEGDHPELYALKVEEAGMATSAGARLLTKLLDHEKFRLSLDSPQFTQLLRELLKSDIPLQSKEWVSACLVKLSNLTEPHSDAKTTINLDVAVYETIPRLVQQMKTYSSPETREAAVVELNRVVSEGSAETTRALACEGGIFPLVELLEEGSNTAVEASLSLLYNLSMDMENHPTIIAAGAAPILRRIVLSEQPQWQLALHLLRTLPI